MNVPSPAPRHPLNQLLPKMVERDGHLHAGVRQVVVAVAQQHHLVMMREVVVRNRDPRRPHHYVDQAILAMRQRAMVDPDIPRPKDGYPIAVGFGAPAVVRRAGAYVSLPRLVAVVDVDVVDDDVADVLQSEAAAADDVDVGAAAVEGLVGVEYQLLRQLDQHVGGEHDPEGLRLDDGVAERARFRGDGVVVGGVRYDVVTAALAAQRVLAEPKAAVGQALAVELPVGVAAPTVVDRVAREAVGSLVISCVG